MKKILIECKNTLDWITGKDRREESVNDLNSYFEKENTGLYFERRQKYLKTMSLAQKVKNNKINKVKIISSFKLGVYK